MRTLLVLLITMIAITACAQAPLADPPRDDAPTAPLPPPPPPPAPEPVMDAPVEEVEEVTDATEVFAGEQTMSDGASISDVRCSFEERSLSFSFTNEADKAWQLNQEVPFPPPKDLTSVKVSINNYEVNGLRDYRDDEGVRYFGPDDAFSENCDGVEELAPGETASCTLYPVPLQDPDAYQNKNHIVIDAVGGDASYSFIC